MYSIRYSITHKLTRTNTKHNLVFSSYAGIGGEIKRAENDHSSAEDSIIVNLTLSMGNVNTVALNPEECASGIDRRILLAIKEEYESLLRQHVLYNEDPKLSVKGLTFHEARRNSVEDICDMDVYTAMPMPISVKVVFTMAELMELNDRDELFSDILAVIIEYPEACYSEKFRSLNGALRSLNLQRIARIAELRKQNEVFGTQGNVYNYFLNDPERRVGTLYVNHLGTVRKITSVSLTYLKKGLYLSHGENENMEEWIVDIDAVIRGEATQYGIYLTEAQARTGTNNSEENTRLTKEIDKLNAQLKEQGRTIAKLNEQKVKAEESNTALTLDIKLLKHDLAMKENLFKGRDQMLKLKEVEQKHKETNDDSLLGRAKRVLGILADVGKSIFGFIDGAAKAKMGATLLGIF